MNKKLSKLIQTVLINPSKYYTKDSVPAVLFVSAILDKTSIYIHTTICIPLHLCEEKVLTITK